MEWSWDLQVGVVELADLVATFILALIIAIVGWRFTNVRAAKDLILKECGKALQVSSKIRKNLRGLSDSVTPRFEYFSDDLDDLGSHLYNSVMMDSKIGNQLNSGRASALLEVYGELRKTLSSYVDQEDPNIFNVFMQISIIEKEIISFMMDANSRA